VRLIANKIKKYNGGSMKSIILMVVVLGLGFSEVLEIDSITDPGSWTNPDSILVSDDLYGSPQGNQDVLTLSFVDPADTVDRSLDSVKVYLEQHVSDTLRAFWFVRPIINGVPRTSTPQQAGTLTDSVLCFDISGDITGWADLYDFLIDLHPKVGTGQQPEWYADYLYVSTYDHSVVSIDEHFNRSYNPVLVMPTIVHNELIFTYNLNTSNSISIDIYNMAGAKVLSKEIHGATDINTITLQEVNQFATGIYYLCIKTGTEHVKLRKFIVLD